MVLSLLTLSTCSMYQWASPPPLGHVWEGGGKSEKQTGPTNGHPATGGLRDNETGHQLSLVPQDRLRHAPAAFRRKNREQKRARARPISPSLLSAWGVEGGACRWPGEAEVLPVADKASPDRSLRNRAFFLISIQQRRLVRGVKTGGPGGPDRSHTRCT